MAELSLLRAAYAATTNTAQGQCSMPLEELVSLLQRCRALQTQLPAPVVLKGAISATCTEAGISVTFDYSVLALADGWNIIALPANLAVVTHHIEGPQGTLQDSFVGVHEGRASAFLHGPGQHTVRITAAAPYSSKAKNGFRLSGLVLASLQTLAVTVADSASLDVTVEPCCALSQAPNADRTATTASGRLPSTTFVDVRWTATRATEHVASIEVAKPMSVSVKQQHLVSVSEGVVFIDSQFDYDIRNGSLSKLELQIDPRVRVLAALGDNVQNFKVAGSVCRVLLDQQAHDTYRLQLTSEMSLAPADGPFAVPVFSHTGMLGLTREMGVLGVEAKSNVEVELANCHAAASIDVEELSQELRGASAGALVLAFKFLQPSFVVQLSVTKHEDQSVLVAAADAAHFIATVTEEGKVMTKLIMRVRNTQKQFVRISVPEDSDIWSGCVDGTPVKPARCERTKAIMVPLSKSSGTEGAPSAFQVELVWVRLAAAGALRWDSASRGRVSITFPKVDLPLNTVFVTVYVPTRYECGNWTGDCRRVTYFSGDVPREQAVSSRATKQRATNVFSQMPQSQMISNVMRSDSSEDLLSVSSKKAKGGAGYGGLNSGSKSSKAGVVPVHATVVMAGQAHLFQRLLVVNAAIDVTAPFTVARRPWRDTRQLDGFLACCHRQ